MNIILSGIVGSTAYGLNTPESDIDRLGVFVSSTHMFLGLHPPIETHTTVKPDMTLHEVGKFIKLALNVNPTVTELLWLDEYENQTEFGSSLIDIRESFLSKNRVRNAYLGYATQQFQRLAQRGDGSFSADTRKRTAKHARHLARLLKQGVQLYSSGKLTVKLEDPEWYMKFGESIANGGDLEDAKALIRLAETDFNVINSPLPEKPNEIKAEQYLQKVRRYFYV